MEILKGDDALEVLDEIFEGLVSLAMGLDAVDLDDLISHVTQPNIKRALLAASEFKNSMEPVLEHRRAMN